jgi:hypothetical protein
MLKMIAVKDGKTFASLRRLARPENARADRKTDDFAGVDQ